MRAALLITCLGDVFYPEVGVAIVRLLRGLGVGVDFPAGQTCCGLPLFNSGYHAEAAAVARRTLPLFRDSEHVVVPSGSCAFMVKHEYPGLMTDPALRAEALALAGRTYELSQFLVACDAGCLMQMGGGLRRRNSPVRAVHLAELLEVDGR